ncbi:class I SAM-dependent methyltransferase [Dactylosporangium sp. NPDC051541]|uniref:class I SAM-dependent methyltransferase n=1 Tax=Dactylosporangium sp. NPDC051541 TaxID=3363977 RepID=UPI0037B02B63
MSGLGRLAAVDVAALQESWDRQQEGYMPDREERFGAMLDAVAATAGPGPVRLLDLAGGTGSITLRALRRFPAVEATVLDLDPALLAIAEATFAEPSHAEPSHAGPSDAEPGRTGRVAVVAADLSAAGWVDALPRREYDAVLTATALHWLPGERVSGLYGEIRQLLRPGGIFVNVDHIPDDGLPTLTKQLLAAEETVRNARYAAGAALSWARWWEHLATIEELAPLVARRHEIYPTGHAAEFTPSLAWHVDALRAAGYSEAGVLWRGGPDAAVAGVR